MYRTFFNLAFLILVLLQSAGSLHAQQVPGTLQGEVSVSLGGSAQYTVPIEAPVGTAGMSPKIFLTYDSNAGPGKLGLGWSVAGLTYISRANRTHFVDGRPGPIDFDNPEDGYDIDGLVLDGSRLIPDDSNPNILSKVIDDQTRIRTFNPGTPQQHFTARTTAGLTIYYGQSETSKIKTVEGDVITWAASKIVDTLGNEIHFLYNNSNGDWGIDEIHYTLHRGDVVDPNDVVAIRKNAFASIKFEYENDPSRRTVAFVGGRQIRQQSYITSVSSYYNETPYRTYNLTYRATERFGQRVLEGIEVEGAELSPSDRQSFPPTKFEYSKNTLSWQEIPDYDLPSEFGEFSSLSSAYRYIDLDNNGTKELLFSAQLDASTKSVTYQFDGSAWEINNTLAPPLVLSDIRTEARFDAFADLNSDGVVDILTSRMRDGQLNSKAYLQTAGGWIEDAQFAFPFEMERDLEQVRSLVDLTDGGDPIFLVHSSDSGGYELWSHTGSWSGISTSLANSEGTVEFLGVGNFSCTGTPILALFEKRVGTLRFVTFDISDPDEPVFEDVAAFGPNGTLGAFSIVKQPACDRLAFSEAAGAVESVSSLELGFDGANYEALVRTVRSNDLNSSKVSHLVAMDFATLGTDGLVVVSDGPGEENVTSYFWDSTLNVWSKDPDYIYNPPTDAQSFGARHVPFVGPVESSGRQSLIFLPAVARTQTASLVNQGGSFVYNVDFVPPVTFVDAAKLGTAPQFADLNADGLADLIGYHVDVEGKTTLNNAYLSLAAGWDELPAAMRLPRPLSYDKGGSSGRFVDLDANGVADYLYSYKGEVGAWKIVFENDVPSRWEAIPAFNPPADEPFVDPDARDRGVRFFDINGDGRTDLVISRRDKNGTQVSKVFLNTGSSWAQEGTASPYLLQVPFVSRFPADVKFGRPDAGDTYRDLGVLLQDQNGDGLVDVSFRYRHNQYLVRSPNPIYSALNDHCQNTNLSVDNPVPNQPPLSFNHPIKLENECAGTIYNTGAGWRTLGPGWEKLSPTNYVVPPSHHVPPLPLDIGLTDQITSIHHVDVNGDGLMDFVPSKKVGNTNIHPVYLNTGEGWSTSEKFKVPYQALATDTNHVNHRFMDLSGDGLVDIVYNSPSGKGAFLNTALGWVRADDSFVPESPFVDKDGNDLGVRIVDVDGNGLPDVIRSWRSKDGKSIRQSELNLPEKLTEESRADVLIAVTTGLGSRSEIRYRPLTSPRLGFAATEFDFYTPSPLSSYPTISYVPTMYAVERLRFLESDGSRLDTRYQYKGFRLDVVSGMPLGFESRIAQNFVNGTPVAREFVELYQSFYLRGRTKMERGSIGGQLLTEISNEYDVVAVGGGRQKQVNLTKSVSRNFDLNGKSLGQTSELITYDEYSNATRSCVEFGDGSVSTSANSYDNNPKLVHPSVWWLGRLVRAEISHFRTSSPLSCASVEEVEGSENVLHSVAEFQYDIVFAEDGSVDTDRSSGLLIKEVANVGHPLALTKEYTYDNFGNQMSVRTSGETGDQRTVSSEYDGLGRFVVTQRNSLGHQHQSTYDPLLGLRSVTVDPNGVATKNSFDGFGRVTETISPTGLRSTQMRILVPENEQFEINQRNVAFKVVEQVGDLPRATKLYDFTGRLLRTETGRIEQDGRERTIIHFAEFDSRGREIRTYLPHYAFPENTSEEAYYSTTQYDDLNRATVVVSPDGSQATSVYDGLVTMVTDSNGNTSSKIINAKGLTLRTTDAQQGELTFSYGPGDRLLRVTQPNGDVLVSTFDQIGNKISGDDPNLGFWEYRHNTFGEVVWQRDAAGKITTISYDQLGRPIQRSMPDLEEVFEYDNAGFGLGKPARTTNSQGYRERYEYDKFGRLAKKTTTIDDERYVSWLSYDQYGRNTETLHPGNFRTRNNYDRNGFLLSVQANDPDDSFLAPMTTHWRALGRDQYGRVLEERVGNGAVTKTSYDPKQGHVEAIDVKIGETEIQSLSLDYDTVGNLIDKFEATSGRNERFDYDSLYRLTRWELNEQLEGEYAFDAVGRILEKSDVGAYEYSDDGPSNAASAIRTNSGETWKYEYDPNGNMVFGPKGRFEYYANNSVKLIYRSDEIWSRFKYAPDGSRYRQLFSQRKQINDMKGSHSLVRTTTVDSFELIEDFGNAFGIAPHGFARKRLHLASDTGVFAILERAVQYDPLHGYEHQMAHNLNQPISIASKTYKARYLHKDELGSIVRITGENGKLIAGYEYDPWGRKTQTISSGETSDDSLHGSLRRGFTGHEHLENLDLIHMNGRVFDATIARFVSADPTLQFPSNLQNYDRYAYAGNNPLKFTDPTGFGWFKKALKKLGNAIAKPFQKIGKWIEKNWKTLVVIVVAVVITVASAGSLGPVAAGMIAGAVSGGLGAALHGGNLDDVLRGAVIGAIIGGLSGGVAELGSAVTAAHGSAAGTAVAGIGGGAVGGLQAEIAGGNFWSGFATGAITASFARHTARLNSLPMRHMANAAVGGTASAVGGGKFANGALFGAFRSLARTSFVAAQQSGEGILGGFRRLGEGLGSVALGGLDIASKVWGGVNTAVGLAWGGLGWALGGDRPILAHNAVVFKNNPLMWAGGGITLGNTISAGQGFNDWGHEGVHTYQSQVLGPFYLPANIGLMSVSAVTSWIPGLGGGPTRAHGRLNFLEKNPYNNELWGH